MYTFMFEPAHPCSNRLIEVTNLRSVVAGSVWFSASPDACGWQTWWVGNVAKVKGDAKSRLVIVGCTGSGKSALAMAVAERLQAQGECPEIVCVDSMTVYRALDIGTAKATREDQAQFPHHCIDLIDPNQEFSVSDFQKTAFDVMADIESRGGLPILVGGTGLYVDALVNELTIPPQFPDVKERLLAEIDSVGPEQLHARLVACDPSAASKMEPTNSRRIVRALEVCEGAGVPFSSFGPGLRESAEHDPTYRQVGLQWERPVLRERIEQRLVKQFADGFLKEAQALYEQWGSSLSKTVKQALGYREIWECLETGGDMNEAREQITVRTRQFAVRQEKWFKRDARITWLPGDTPLQELVEHAIPNV